MADMQGTRTAVNGCARNGQVRVPLGFGWPVREGAIPFADLPWRVRLCVAHPASSLMPLYHTSTACQTIFANLSDSAIA